MLENLSHTQWKTLFLMCKDGEVSTTESGLRVCSSVQQSFTLWYLHGSSPIHGSSSTHIIEIEIHRNTLLSEFWLTKLRVLFNVWKSSYKS